MMRDIVVMDGAKQRTFWLSLERDCQIHFVTTAGEGLEMLSENTGLVFVNLKLPDMNGMDVLKLIKETHPSIPVIVITLCSTVGTCAEAFENGARDYLRVPLNAGETARKIDLLLHINKAPQRRHHVSLSTAPLQEEQYPDIPVHLVKSVLKVRDFIAQQYAETLTLHEACKMASLSKTYFCHFFKCITGHSLRNYQHVVKVHRAEELLKDRSLSITDVAERLGYNDSNYFSTIYKKVTGSCPKYRRASEQPSL